MVAPGFPVMKLVPSSAEKEENADSTNHWMALAEMKAKLNALNKGCMKGRTLYVITFSKGLLGSNIAKNCVEITDSALFVVQMRIITCVFPRVLELIAADNNNLIEWLHSIVKTLAPGDASCHSTQKTPSSPTSHKTTKSCPSDVVMVVTALHVMKARSPNTCIF